MPISGNVHVGEYYVKVETSGEYNISSFVSYVNANGREYSYTYEVPPEYFSKRTEEGIPIVFYIVLSFFVLLVVLDFLGFYRRKKMRRR
ncbi:MAG: hypothetical protein ACP6IP_06900 [Candidatus Njordarchaeia archaeon]